MKKNNVNNLKLQCTSTDTICVRCVHYLVVLEGVVRKRQMMLYDFDLEQIMITVMFIYIL